MEITYEAKIEQAKAILKDLANPELPLDQATKLYKEGMNILEDATKMLEQAKLEYSEYEPKES